MMEKLGEYCKVISGFAFKSQDLSEGTDIPVIKIGNISNGKGVILDDSTQYVSKDFLSIDDKYHVTKGDILISLTGSHINQPNSMVGRSCRNFSDTEFLLNQRAGKVIPNQKADKDYLYYLLNTESFKYSICNRAYGAANQANVSPSDIEDIKWDFPSLSTQKKIASILSAYDNLIENNNKRIKILKQMAENLYKEWFVRFRFPGHKTTPIENGIPKGWEIVVAEDRYDITIGKTPPRKEFEWFTSGCDNAQNWLSISDMTDIFVGETSEQLTYEAVKRFNMIVVPKDTILLSFKLTVGRVAIAMGELCTNEAIAHFKNFNEYEREYLFLMLRNYDYNKLGNTSAIGNAINSKIVKAMKLTVPTQQILKAFHSVMKPVFDQISNIMQQNQNLIIQRDLLLPRLMSGKLAV